MLLQRRFGPFAFAGALALAGFVVAHSVTAQPAIEWRRGDVFFRLGGRPSFLLGRNPTGTTPEMFGAYFAQAVNSGEKLVRIHLTVGFPQTTKAGEMDEAWAARWDSVFDAAAAKDIGVLPVFDAWADWNDGSRGEQWHRWDKNPYNVANGGPARRPAGLFENGECQRLWLRWLDQLVHRWQARPNIIGWEIFSELDLITGGTEETAVPFIHAAATVIHEADERRRPVTASLSGVREWTSLFRSDALDIVQVHPYGRNLDEMILRTVRRRQADYDKPVLIGECGLDPAGPGGIASAPRAEIGIRHAIWAAMISGAMNGRMLWWEDGYDFYSGRNLRQRYKNIAATAAAFARDVNFADFRPVEMLAADGLKGGAIGNDHIILGWFRDAKCEPPEWPVRLMTGRRVTLKLPQQSTQGSVEFRNPVGGSRRETQTVSTQSGQLEIALPDFEDAIAFVVRRDAR